MDRNSVTLPYLILAAGLLVAIVAFFALVRPMWQRVQATRVELAATTTQLQEKTEFLQAVDRKQARLVQEEASERQLAVVLPSDEAIDDVARIIHRAGETSGVTVMDLADQSTAEQGAARAAQARGGVSSVPEGVQLWAIKVRGRGSYQQIRTWVGQLEKSPRLLDVMSLTLSQVEGQADALEADLAIRFYSFVEPAL